MKKFVIWSTEIQGVALDSFCSYNCFNANPAINTHGAAAEHELLLSSLDGAAPNDLGNQGEAGTNLHCSSGSWVGDDSLRERSFTELPYLSGQLCGHSLNVSCDKVKTMSHLHLV